MKTSETYTPEEIIAKLKWFHGEDFTKYPLDDATREHQKKNEY